MDEGTEEAQELNARLEKMWRTAREEIQSIDPETLDWKKLAFPPASVKNIMKMEVYDLNKLNLRNGNNIQNNDDSNGSGGESSDKPSKISRESPVLMIKACELFVQELTVRAWRHSEGSRRKTVHKADINAAVGETEVFDFLIDVVPRVTPIINNVPQPQFPTGPPPPIPDNFQFPPNYAPQEHGPLPIPDEQEQQQVQEQPAIIDEEELHAPHHSHEEDPTVLLDGHGDLPNFSVENLQLPQGDDNAPDSSVQQFSPRMQQQQWQSEESVAEL